MRPGIVRNGCGLRHLLVIVIGSTLASGSGFAVCGLGLSRAKRWLGRTIFRYWRVGTQHHRQYFEEISALC